MVVTCGAEEERYDGHVRHVADGGLEGQAEHHKGDAAVLDGGLQGDCDNLSRCGKFNDDIVCPVLACHLQMMPAVPVTRSRRENHLERREL